MKEEQQECRQDITLLISSEYQDDAQTSTKVRLHSPHTSRSGCVEPHVVMCIVWSKCKGQNKRAGSGSDSRISSLSDGLRLLFSCFSVFFLQCFQ